MAGKPEFNQDVVDRLTRIEKILSERFTRSFDRLPIDAMSENKEIAYLTKLRNKDILQPKPDTLECYKLKDDEETKTYS